MTPEITDLIKKKAEEKFPHIKGSVCNYESFLQRKEYIIGQTEGVELMIGFTEWVGNNYVKLHPSINLEKWFSIKNDDNYFYTITELLTKYIKEVLSK